VLPHLLSFPALCIFYGLPIADNGKKTIVLNRSTEFSVVVSTVQLPPTVELNQYAQASLAVLNSAGTYSMDEAVAIHVFTESVFADHNQVSDFIPEEKIPRDPRAKQLDYVVRGTVFDEPHLFFVSVVRAWIHPLSRKKFGENEAMRLMKKKLSGLYWAARAVYIPGKKQARLVLQILSPNMTNVIWCLRAMEELERAGEVPKALVYATIFDGKIKHRIFASKSS
jgi:hypothetical protein